MHERVKFYKRSSEIYDETAKCRSNVNVVVPENLGQGPRVSLIIMLCYTTSKDVAIMVG